MTRSHALVALPYELSVVRLEAGSPLPEWAAAGGFWSLTGTQEELSIVCETDLVPSGTAAVAGWRAMKVAGPLQFGEVGVLAGLTDTLARSGISVFVVSTYDTDYVLVKREALPEAATALREVGHTFHFE